MHDIISRFDKEFLIVYAAMVLASWLIMISAVIVDFWSGCSKAKRLGQPLISEKFRKTVVKVGDYWRIQLFGLFIDFFSAFWVVYPIATWIITVAIIIIEIKSVIENYKKVESPASNIIEAVSILTSLKDKDFKELLNKLGDYTNSSDSSKSTGRNSNNTEADPLK